MDKLVLGVCRPCQTWGKRLSKELPPPAPEKATSSDHADTFLDTDHGARPACFLSSERVLPVDGAELTLLDTPGHAELLPARWSAPSRCWTMPSW